MSPFQLPFQLPVQYNPTRNTSATAPLKPSHADRTMAEIVKQVTDQMKKDGWTPPPPPPGGNPDPGAFGKEVHNRVSVILGKRKNWVMNVYVDNTTNKVVSIGEPPPGGVAALNNTTQIDAAFVHSGYRPKVGQVWDATKADVYEIKTSAYGALLKGDQLDRLQALSTDARVRLVRPQEIYTQGSWTVNKRVKQVIRILELIGLATAAWNVIHYSDFDAEFEQLRADVAYAASRTNVHDKLATRLQVIDDTKLYLSHFLPSDTAVSGISIAAIYKLLDDYGKGFPANDGN